MKKLMQLLLMMLTLVGCLTIAHPTTHADDTLQKVKQKGELTVALSPDYPPFEFQITKNNHSEDAGLDIDIIKKLAKNLGVKLKIKNMAWSSVLVAVETGKADMAIGGINPTEERAKSVDFSKVYYQGGQCFLINKKDKGLIKNQADLKGKTVGTQTGTLQSDLAKKNLVGSKKVNMEKTIDLIIGVKTHKVDAVGVEKPVGAAYVQNDPDLAMINSDYQLSKKDTGCAMVFRKGDTSMVKAANQTIDQIQKQHLVPQYLKSAGKEMKTNTADTSMFHYWKYFYNGLKCTLLISVVSVLGGIILGILLALMKLSKFKWLSWPAISYVEIVRGTPMMVQVLLVYFGLGVLINLPALLAGMIAVTLNSAAYVCEVIRGGILSVEKGQKEATKSLGLNKIDAMRFVILPQALKNIWPALGNEFISVIKESSIVSIIGVTDLVYELNVVRADTYRGVAPIVVVMIIYFLLTFTLTRLLNYWENKMKHN